MQHRLSHPLWRGGFILHRLVDRCHCGAFFLLCALSLASQFLFKTSLLRIEQLRGWREAFAVKTELLVCAVILMSGLILNLLLPWALKSPFAEQIDRDSMVDVVICFVISCCLVVSIHFPLFKAFHMQDVVETQAASTDLAVSAEEQQQQQQRISARKAALPDMISNSSTVPAVPRPFPNQAHVESVTVRGDHDQLLHAQRKASPEPAGHIVTLEQLRRVADGMACFKAFLMSEFSVENLLFLEEAEAFHDKYASQQLARPTANRFRSEMLHDARQIFFTYIADSAPLQVCLTDFLFSLSALC